MWHILISVRTAESRVQCTCRFSCAGSFHHHQVFPRSVDVFDTPCWTAHEGSLFSSYCSSNNTRQQETRNPSQMPTGFLVLSLYSFADPHFISLHNGDSKGSCLKEHPVGWSCHCYSEEQFYYMENKLLWKFLSSKQLQEYDWELACVKS